MTEETLREEKRPPKKKTTLLDILRRFAPLAILIGGLLFFVRSGALDSVSFEGLRDNRDWLMAQVAANPALALVIYVAVYAAATAAFLPGASIFTMAGGFLFGIWLGTAAAMAAASLGALVVFLASRTAFGDTFRGRLSAMLPAMERGFRDSELAYLFILRLVPLFPFYAVNIAAGLLRVRLWKYVVSTVIGIAPGAFVYAGLGAGLDELIAAGETPDFWAAFLKPEIILPIIGLVLLAFAPIIYKARTSAGTDEATA